MSLDSIFYPKSVAIIGVSPEPNKIGHVILKNFLDAGFPGKVYPVHPTAEFVLGIKCYKSVLDIPGKVDSAIFAIPGKFVPDVLEECGKKGIKGAVVISAGFSEAGNFDLEKQLIDTAKKYGISVIGPNCLGVVNPLAKVDSVFLPTYKMGRPKVGGIAFATQSGAIGTMILDLVAHEGFGISKFISYGNASVIDETDLLEYLGKDKKTRMIVLYIEGVKRGKAFFALTKKLAKKKPIVVIKAGVTEKGAAAAKSHTGSLAGSYAAYKAVFKQNRMIEAKSIEDIFDFAKIFETQPACTGDRVLIVTNGGGMGVLTADAVIESGLKLAELSEESKAAIKAKMPPLVFPNNPLDLLGDCDATRYEEALKIIANDPGIDAIIVATLFQTASLDSRVVESILKIAGSTKKPVINISVGGEYTEIQRRALEGSGVPSYISPTSAVHALAKLIEHSRYCKE